MKYLCILFCTLFLGCSTRKVCSTSTVSSTTSSELATMKYSKLTGRVELDLFDKYLDAIYEGRIVFKLPIAAIIYLVTNVEFFNSRPEEEFSIDNITVRIVIFRWRF